MFSLGSSHRFYLYDGHCDMRKSFDGLCGLVVSVMQRQPTSGEVFVFLNRSRTHIKLLHWERGGFVLYYKRLEQGTFGTSALKKVSYRGASGVARRGRPGCEKHTEKTLFFAQETAFLIAGVQKNPYP